MAVSCVGVWLHPCDFILGVVASLFLCDTGSLCLWVLLMLPCLYGSVMAFPYRPYALPMWQCDGVPVILPGLELKPWEFCHHVTVSRKSLCFMTVSLCPCDSVHLLGVDKASIYLISASPP